MEGKETNVDSTEMSGTVWAGSKQENSSTCYVHKAGSSIVIPSSSLQGVASANKEASCSWFACLFALVRYLYFCSYVPMGHSHMLRVSSSQSLEECAIIFGPHQLG